MTRPTITAGARQAASCGDGVTLHDMSGPDSPAQRATRSAAQQAQRVRRAEAVRLRQRAVLLELMAKTMAELQISMAELSEARRALAPSAPVTVPVPPT